MSVNSVEPRRDAGSFPGEWHHYQPDPDTGWSEYWLGFCGSDASRTVRALFKSEEALQKVGQADAMIQLFDQLLHWIRQPFTFKKQTGYSPREWLRIQAI